jgi:tetratricopeptide (TPR) repeat protein
VLETLEPNAILFADGDAYAFPAMYLQVVEGARPDVVQAMPYGYVEPHLYEDMPEKMRRRIPRVPGRRDTRNLERWIVTHQGKGRPIYFSEPVGDRKIPGYELQPEGLLWRLVAENDAAESRRISVRSRALLQRYDIREIDAPRPDDEFAREVIMFLERARAVQHLHDGQVDQGLAAWDRATAVMAGYAWPQTMAGSLVAMAAAEPERTEAERKRMYERAVTYFDRALAVRAEDVAARTNKAQALDALGRYDDAIELLIDTLRLHPKRFRLVPPGQVVRLLATEYGRRGFKRLEADDLRGALHDFEESLRLWPNQKGLPDLAAIRRELTGPR